MRYCIEERDTSLSKAMTVGEAFLLCEKDGNRLLNFSLEKVQNAEVFPTTVVEMLRTVAKEVEKNRRKKNIGVIGGSVTSIAGGAIAIAGAILIPFTFAISTSLLVSGAVVGLVGGGVSMGFSLNKFFNDKKRKNAIKPALNTFVVFQKRLALCVVNVQLAQQIVTDIMENDSHLLEMELDNEDMESVIELHVASSQHTFMQEDGIEITTLIEEMSLFSEQLAHCLVQLVKPYREQILESEDEELWYEQRFNKAGELPFDGLISAVNSLKTFDDTENTFGGFVLKYYKENSNPSPSNTFLPARATMDAAGNICARGGAAGSAVARIGLKAIVISDDISSVGGMCYGSHKGFQLQGSS
ncbi:hypothetical protein BSL78_18080 [Apostichopus japonicus]|uniref:Uncharacterized protein n=1 Tax=Stichopus japonicus TaxID=307972 RepID=A0A2G8KAM5_STIJA|nr:hypothetical protein BSL78_18080 [Apostichopus japonicus]